MFLCGAMLQKIFCMVSRTPPWGFLKMVDPQNHGFQYENGLNLDDLRVRTPILGNLQMLVQHCPKLSQYWYKHLLTWPSVPCTSYPKLWHDTSRLRGQRCQRDMRSVCNACQNMLYLPGSFQSVISNMSIETIEKSRRVYGRVWVALTVIRICLVAGGPGWSIVY